MFSYCGNNPVCRTDPTGNSWVALITTLIEVVNQVLKRVTGDNHFSPAPEQPPIRDVTNEVEEALKQASYEAYRYRVGSVLKFGGIAGAGLTYYRFYTLVNHYASWDIKREESWEKTIGTPFPGDAVQVYFNDELMTPEDLGNFTYGVLGHAYGIPLEHLIPGSWYAAGFPTEGEAWDNEIRDWGYIVRGYGYARGG